MADRPDTACDCIPDVFCSFSCRKCGRSAAWPNERWHEVVQRCDKAEARLSEYEQALREILTHEGHRANGPCWTCVQQIVVTARAALSGGQK